MRTSISILAGAARSALAAGLAALFAFCFAACAASDEPGRKSALAIGARIQPIAGGVGHGLISFKPYDGGLVLVADVGGFSSGPYRIVIHTTPVCTSPNGFSAGPPFVPPGATEPVVVPTVIYQQGTATLSTRVPGLTLSGPAGIEGKSIVLHASRSGSLDATPGTRNDRVACGVIGVIPTLF